jgi:dephospho-CoA kinase
MFWNRKEILGGRVFSEDGRLDRVKVATIIFKERELRDALSTVEGIKGHCFYMCNKLTRSQQFDRNY